MVSIQIQTTPNYVGPKNLVLDRVPCEGEAINCWGGYLLVKNVVHLPADNNPPSGVIKADFYPVDRG